MVALSCLLLMACLPGILDVMPMMLGSLIRNNPHIKLCESNNKSRHRDYAAMAMFLPVIMLSARYRLHPLIPDTNPMIAILVSAAIWASYILLRWGLNIFLRGRLSNEAWKVSATLPVTFFAVGSMTIFAILAVMGLAGAPEDLRRSVILWSGAVFYGISLIRRYQIFAHYRGYFSGFLYLCTLEFVPTGILVGGAALF